jgi:outer membrane protein assembly factor BamB
LTLAWKVKVGAGHSSPVATGMSVFLHSREGEEEVVSRFDLATGRRLWRQAYPAPYTMSSAASGHGKGPKSTPAVEGGRIFTLGISGILSAFDTETGRLAWRKDFRGRFRETFPIYGTAMSPVVDSGLLILHAGGHDDGALVALAAATGEERWAWKGDGPGYASPVVAELAGVRQVVTQTQNNVVGLSLDRGELLWKVPFRTDYDQNAVTPVVHEQAVIYSGLGNGTRAVRVVKRGASVAAEPEWENREVSMYLSSPVLAGDRLYGLSHRERGQLFCLDPRTGATIWAGPGRQGENAALVAAGGSILVLTTDAKLIVVRGEGSRFDPVATYAIADSPTWAHPAVVREGILVKDVETLALWRVD